MRTSQRYDGSQRNRRGSRGSAFMPSAGQIVGHELSIVSLNEAPREKDRVRSVLFGFWFSSAKDEADVDFGEAPRDGADPGRAATALGRVEGWTMAGGPGARGGRGGGYLGNCTGKVVDTTAKNADQWRTTYKAMLLPGYHQPSSARPMAAPAKSVPRTRLDSQNKYAIYGAPRSARTPRRRGPW